MEMPYTIQLPGTEPSQVSQTSGRVSALGAAVGELLKR